MPEEAEIYTSKVLALHWFNTVKDDIDLDLQQIQVDTTETEQKTAHCDSLSRQGHVHLLETGSLIVHRLSLAQQCIYPPL
jgi:hypothetical protein